MTSVLELSARAALCRQLAKREPDSRNLWLAEAKRWSRLAPESRAKAVGQIPGAWCWIIKSGRRPSDLDNAEVRFEFRNAAGGDGFNELLSGMPAEADAPH